MGPRTIAPSGASLFLVLVGVGACRAPAPPSTDCASCHAAEVAALASSHHARGQAIAGRLPAGSVDGFTITSDGGLLYREPDGGLATARLRYTLGVEPIVQVAVELANGKVQVPPIGLVDGGWRLLPASLAGAVGDWRQPPFDWAASCAPCHATGFESLKPSWKSLSITCEACHGDASGHLAWLRESRPVRPAHGFARSLSSRTNFAFPPDGGAIARAVAPPKADVEGRVCAGCHARRRPLRDGASTAGEFLDEFEPGLMEPGLYDDTGAVLDEVYEVNSFSMSPMHRAGVRCSDCHDPHSSKLRPHACARCHRPEVFDTPAHRGEEPRCEACHLPEKTFLGVQVRHDHLVRRGRQVRVDSAFVLASNVRDVEQAARSDDALVRYGAARALGRLAPPERVRIGAALLGDARRAVRVQAARALLGLVALPAPVRGELETAERANTLRGEAWLNLSALALADGDRALAAQQLRRGLLVEPHFAPLTINLADLVRGEEGRALLEAAALDPGPWDCNVAYALGLARWRAKDKEGALAAFRIAAQDGAPEHLEALRMALGELARPPAGPR